jgi:hypothetical protein
LAQLLQRRETTLGPFFLAVTARWLLRTERNTA